MGETELCSNIFLLCESLCAHLCVARTRARVLRVCLDVVPEVFESEISDNSVAFQTDYERRAVCHTVAPFFFECSRKFHIVGVGPVDRDVHPVSFVAAAR